MSAKRMSLLATAVILGGVLAPTATSWAQPALGYGTKSIVDHNDLRWFEPVELDLDGQMPRRDAGFYFTADKIWWGTIHPTLEIGQAGLTVDSERIYRAPSNDTAFLALQQTEGFGFIDNLNENLSYTGIQFVVANTMGTDSLNDDLVMPFDISGLSTVAELEAAIEDFNTDQNNIDANLTARVGGEPRPYEVRNGIRDALPDAGFAWGERYEFGYSNGEQGWMVTVLDGPESQAGGTFGANEDFETDPFYRAANGDADNDGEPDGDGPITDGDPVFAFGFGSVAVNFNLPSEDFLLGFRDYFNGDGSSGTVAGPLLYVGQYGADFDGDVLPNDITNNPTLVGVNVNDGLGAITVYDAQASDPPTTDPNAAILTQQINIILADINSASAIVPGLDDDDAQDALNALIANAQAAVAALQTAQNLLAANNGGNIPPNQLDPEIQNVQATLTVLNVALAGVVLDVDDTDVTTDGDTAQDRFADDLDGNGQAAVFNVLADIDGDGVIEATEVVGRINNFADLHQFNIYFNEVTVRNTTEIDSVEVMRTHELSTRHKLEQGRWDDLRMTYGVRFLNIEDDFFFNGDGSIIGQTWVNTNAENQIIAPQLGLRWTRRDGPWNFILEARGAVGYNIVDVDQEGIFGRGAIPGALNNSLSARPTTSVDGSRFEEFSPIGELRAQLRYRIAESVSVHAGYTAKYVGNIHRGGDSTAWNAPDFGVHDHTAEIFTNGLNFGVEFRH